MTVMTGAVASHVGNVRDVNQDRAMHGPTLGAVADGMGGHAGGEKAAAMAIAELNGIRGAVSERRLVDVVEAANRRIYEAATDPKLRGMGTTIVAAGFDPSSGVVTLVNVGDSRGYLLRGDDMTQVTVDHSLVEDLVRDGRISAEEARSHPQRNIVTRALGIGPDVNVDAFAIRVEPGDRLVLASDGLSNEVDDEALTRLVQQHADAQEAADVLVAAALDGGGRDNVTVVVLDFDGEPSEDGADERAVGAEDSPDAHDPLAGVSKPRRRRFPLRSLLLATVVVFVIGVVGFGTSWYADRGFFAEPKNDVVAIYRGRPGGFLWFRPELVEEHPELRVEDLDGASLQRLEQRPVWSTVDDARDFVENLESTSSGS